MKYLILHSALWNEITAIFIAKCGILSQIMKTTIMLYWQQTVECTVYYGTRRAVICLFRLSVFEVHDHNHKDT